MPRGGQYVLAPGCDPDLETVAAPPSLQALVAARLDGSDPGAATRRRPCERGGGVVLAGRRRCAEPRRGGCRRGAGQPAAAADPQPGDPSLQCRARPLQLRADGGPPGRLLAALPARPQGTAPGGRGPDGVGLGPRRHGGRRRAALPRCRRGGPDGPRRRRAQERRCEPPRAGCGACRGARRAGRGGRTPHGRALAGGCPGEGRRPGGEPRGVPVPGGPLRRVVPARRAGRGDARRPGRPHGGGPCRRDPVPRPQLRTARPRPRQRDPGALVGGAQGRHRRARGAVPGVLDDGGRPAAPGRQGLGVDGDRGDPRRACRRPAGCSPRPTWRSPATSRPPVRRPSTGCSCGPRPTSHGATTIPSRWRRR